jgi:hypothetical protein
VIIKVRFETLDTPATPNSMENPDQDNERMRKWRRELGPDERPYRDD